MELYTNIIHELCHRMHRTASWLEVHLCAFCIQSGPSRLQFLLLRSRADFLFSQRHHVPTTTRIHTKGPGNFAKWEPSHLYRTKPFFWREACVSVCGVPASFCFLIISYDGEPIYYCYHWADGCCGFAFARKAFGRQNLQDSAFSPVCYVT